MSKRICNLVVIFMGIILFVSCATSYPNHLKTKIINSLLYVSFVPDANRQASWRDLGGNVTWASHTFNRETLKNAFVGIDVAKIIEDSFKKNNVDISKRMNLSYLNSKKALPIKVEREIMGSVIREYDLNKIRKVIDTPYLIEVRIFEWGFLSKRNFSGKIKSFVSIKAVLIMYDLNNEDVIINTNTNKITTDMGLMFSEELERQYNPENITDQMNFKLSDFKNEILKALNKRADFIVKKFLSSIE